VVLRLRPVWSLALVASVLLLAVLPSPEPGPQLGDEEGIAQFVGRFPGARSVNVVGSFNDWGPVSIPLEDRDHNGVWQAAVVLPAGTHEYMFVVDGERWVVDPLAGRFVEDGFGRENSLLIVRPLPR
jgi:1,4-alpha-glucan branching enzyme